MVELSLPAPGKINLFLHILAQRADGSHQLQTLYQFVDLGERIEFNRHPSELHAEGISIPPTQNLILRAARLLREHVGISAGAHIRVHKTMPCGGGLGGGSSDAATTLHGLTQLWQLSLSVEELMKLGARLGADVPVFALGQAAIGEDVGTLLTPCSPPERWCLILHPGIGIHTKDIFQHPNLRRGRPALSHQRLLAESSDNDCAPLVYSLYPELARARDWLGQNHHPLLNGTGSCLFAHCKSADAAHQLADTVPAGWSAWAVRTSNHSPLLSALQNT